MARRSEHLTSTKKATLEPHVQHGSTVVDGQRKAEFTCADACLALRARLGR
ncbi:hypothetical protein [Polyangium fumosum]|uniref:hypothetical protein n=1 Tax=Polyangium fumosum TaxID=889272 RepID=UPI001478EC29|nr:hypothetical protein [Polyangium fumosum]